MKLFRLLGWQVSLVILFVAGLAIAQGPFNPSNVQYRIVPGEKGVTTLSYPVGHAFRYGITCNRTTDYTTQSDNVMIAATLPGVTAYYPKCLYNIGFNTRAVVSYGKYNFDHADFINIAHVIASGTTATATCTVAGGVVTAVTVTGAGTGYYGLAPKLTIASGGGGNLLTGANVPLTLEASAIDTIVNGGSGYAVNDTFTTQNSIVLTVSSISSGGVVTGLSVTTRGAMSDSRPTAYPYVDGNQYTQVSTSGNGSGLRVLLNFRVPTGATTVVGAGTGGNNGNCTATIDPPMFTGGDFAGNWGSYTRFGVQNVSKTRFGKLWAKSDTTLTGGLRQSGSHFDSVQDIDIEEYNCDDAEDRVGYSGFGCFVLEAQAGRQSSSVRIRRMLIEKGDVNGVAICNSSFKADEVIIKSYGRGAAIAGTPYCIATTNNKGVGLFLYRAQWDIGSLIVMNNEQLRGALAKESVLVVSTSQATNPLVTEDNLSPRQSIGSRGSSFGDVLLTNVATNGGFLLDNATETSTAGCDVAARSIRVQFSGTTAMTAAKQGVYVGPPSASASAINSACTLDVGLVELFSTGADSNNILATQPEGFKVASGGIARVGVLRIPNAGVGSGNGLVQIEGQFIGMISYDQKGSANLPTATAAGVPVINVKGTGVVGSDLSIIAKVTNNNLSIGTGGFLAIDAATDARIKASFYNMRTGSQIKLSNNPTDIDLDARIYGLNDTGQGIEWPGVTAVQATRLRLRGHIQDVAIGLYKSANSPTCTNCFLDGMTLSGNGTSNSNLTAGFFTDMVNYNGEYVASGPMKRASYAFASLPASPKVGDMAIVSDAAACAFATATAGGGAVVCPVIWDGTNWIGG